MSVEETNPFLENNEENQEQENANLQEMREKSKKQEESFYEAKIKELQAAIENIKKSVQEQSSSAQFSPDTFLKAIETVVNRNTIGNNNKIYYPEDEFDMNDLLENPVTFFMYSHSSMISDDTRYGQLVKRPFKRIIIFKNVLRHEVERNGAKRLLSLCSYTTNSKKELEFLRSHSLFGVTFFEEGKSKKSLIDSADYMRIATDSHSAVLAMRETEVMHNLRSRGLNQYISTDIEGMRRALVGALIDEKYRAEPSVKTKPVSPDRMEDAIEEEFQRNMRFVSPGLM